MFEITALDLVEIQRCALWPPHHTVIRRECRQGLNSGREHSRILLQEVFVDLDASAILELEWIGWIVGI
jgi:hypothetical protein